METCSDCSNGGEEAPVATITVVSAVSGEMLHSFSTRLESLTTQAISRQVANAMGIPHYEQQLSFDGHVYYEHTQDVHVTPAIGSYNVRDTSASVVVQLMRLDHTEEIARWHESFQNWDEFESWQLLQRLKDSPEYVRADERVMLAGFMAEAKYADSRDFIRCNTNLDWISHSVIAFAAGDLRSRAAFMLRAMEIQQFWLNGDCSCLQFASEPLRSNPDFVREALARNGGAGRCLDFECAVVYGVAQQ